MLVVGKDILVIPLELMIVEDYFFPSLILLTNLTQLLVVFVIQSTDVFLMVVDKMFLLIFLCQQQSLPVFLALLFHYTEFLLPL